MLFFHGPWKPNATSFLIYDHSIQFNLGEEEQFAFKRALSRLVEMTSAAYNRVDRWTPLPQDACKWETVSSPTLGPSDGPIVHDSAKPDRGLAHDSDDFAQEASFKKMNTTFKRPHAPQLSPEHVWGVREDWGGNDKDWGKCAKVFDRKGNMVGRGSTSNPLGK